MDQDGNESLDLADVRFVAAASARGIAHLRERTRLVPYPAGTTIFKEGDPPDALYVVRDGTVEIRTSNLDGTMDVRRTLGSRELLGELGILGGRARTATAHAVEDSNLWAIEREAFLELYEAEPAVSVEIATMMARYLLDADDVAEELLFLDLEGRVARRLLLLAQAPGSRVSFATATDDLSKEQVQERLRDVARSARMAAGAFGELDRLALLSGGTMRSVQRVLSDLQRDGLLIVAEGSIVLLDEEGLQGAAQPG